MTAIVNNIRSVWSVCGLIAEGCGKTIKRELHEIAENWEKAEAYWCKHPELRPEYCHHYV